MKRMRNGRDRKTSRETERDEGRDVERDFMWKPTLLSFATHLQYYHCRNLFLSVNECKSKNIDMLLVSIDVSLPLLVYM